MNTVDPSSDARYARGPAGDLWRHTLSRIPSLFGRLIYLSSLRNQNTGAYEHHGLAQMIGAEQSASILHRSHTQIFQEWLCLSLEMQKADLDEYLANMPGDTAAVLATWTSLTPYRNLVPAGAQDVEKQLYISDMETILELLKREHGAAAPDRES